MRVVVVTPPAPILTLEEVRDHLKLDEGDDDTFIEAAIEAVVNHLSGPDGWLGRSLGLQTLELRLDSFDGGCADGLILPYRPIVSIISVKYLDPDNVERTLASGAYEMRGHRLGGAYQATWPALLNHPEAVRIQYQAGYEALPKDLRAALLLMIHDLYRNRGTITIGASATATPMSTSVENLLAPYRVFH